MRDVFYHSFVNFMGMFLWRGELIGQAILPGQGSAVLVANHADSFDPIAAVCALPMSLHT